MRDDTIMNKYRLLELIEVWFWSKQPHLLNHHTSMRGRVIDTSKQSSVLTLTYILQLEIPSAFLDPGWK